MMTLNEYTVLDFLLGRALDIAATGVPSLGSSKASQTPSFERGVAFQIAWSAMSSTAVTKPYWDYWQLEGIDGPADKVRTSSTGWVPNKRYDLDINNDGILDGYALTGHLHLQDDPTVGVH